MFEDTKVGAAYRSSLSSAPLSSLPSALVSTFLCVVVATTCSCADNARGTLLWSVESSQSGKATLFGTVHSLELEHAREYHGEVIEKLDASAVVVVEVDTANVDATEYSRRALLDDDAPGLDTQLSPDEWGELRITTADLLPESTLARVKPWYALQLFTQASVLQREEPMDIAIEKAAKTRGAEVRYLETWQDQVAAFEAAYDINALKVVLGAGSSKLGEQTRDLEVYWLAGHVEKVEAQLKQASAEQQRHLLDARNERWASSITELMRTETRPVFIAVGAGHLLRGEKGLPHLLRQNGLAVSRTP